MRSECAGEDSQPKKVSRSGMDASRPGGVGISNGAKCFVTVEFIRFGRVNWWSNQLWTGSVLRGYNWAPQPSLGCSSVDEA